MFQRNNVFLQGDEFINQLNDLCGVLSLTTLKQRNNLSGGTSLSKELPVKENRAPVERKRVGSTGDIGSKHYSGNIDSSKGLNKNYKNLICDTKSHQKSSVLGAKGHVAGSTMSHRYDTKKTDSEYINIYHHTEK